MQTETISDRDVARDTGPWTPGQTKAPHRTGGRPALSPPAAPQGASRQARSDSVVHFAAVRSYTVTPPTVLDENMEATQLLIAEEVPELPGAPIPPGPAWPPAA